MVESATLHSTTPQQAASWRPVTSSSAAAKRGVTAPSAAGTSPAISCTPPMAIPQFLQAPCAAATVGFQATPYISGAPGHDIQTLPNYQLGYGVAEQARIASPCIQGIVQSPQPVFMQGQPPEQTLVGSVPQGVASQPLVSAGFPAFQHGGIRQLQTSTVPVQIQLPRVQQPQNPVLQQQVLHSKQTSMPHVQAPAQGVFVPSIQTVGVVPPECVKVTSGAQVDGSVVLQQQQTAPTVNLLNVLSNPTTARGGSPHVLVQHIQPEAHGQFCSVPSCPSLFGTTQPKEPERLITQTTSPAGFNFISIHQQPTANQGLSAVPLYFPRGQQFGFQVGSPNLMTGATVATAATAPTPGLVVLPLKSWESQSFTSSNAVAGRTQVTVIPGTPVSSLYCVDRPTASVTVGPPFPTQHSAGFHSVAPLLRTLPLGGSIPSSGAVQLLQANSGIASFPRTLPTSINVVPSSLATLVPSDTFNRRKRAQSPGTTRCPSFYAQPFASCCIPAANSSR